MPTYCYVNKSGKVVERIYPIGKAPSTIKLDGSRYARCIAVEHAGFRNTPGNWPQKTTMSGVLPSQANELRDFLQRKGVPTEVCKDGEMILRDRAHRKQVHQALGYYDRDGGYGDAAPTHQRG